MGIMDSPAGIWTLTGFDLLKTWSKNNTSSPYQVITQPLLNNAREIKSKEKCIIAGRSSFTNASWYRDYLIGFLSMKAIFPPKRVFDIDDSNLIAELIVLHDAWCEHYATEALESEWFLHAALLLPHDWLIG